MNKIITEYTKNNPHIKVDKIMFDSGGMKKVYYAEDTINKSQYVLKIVEINNDITEKRTRRELEILESLNSDYFPKIYDVAYYTDDEKNYIVILEQRINGANLRNRMEKRRFSENESIQLCTQLIRALKIIHKEGLVHRDIKPDNIMITDTNELVLFVFGIARDLTDSSNF